LTRDRTGSTARGMKHGIEGVEH